MPALQSRPFESISTSSRSGNSPFSPASFVTNHQDTRGLSLGTNVNSDTPLQGHLSSHAEGFSQSQPQTILISTTLDPVDMGLISRLSSQNLYEGWVFQFEDVVICVTNPSDQVPKAF